MKRKICVVTGSRADYGYLVEVLRELEKTGAFDLQIVVTGSHLAREFGQTDTVIAEDGFSVTERVPVLGGGDTPLDTVEATGRGVIGMGAALTRLAPGLVVVMGDRFEIFAAAQAAFLLGLPVAHIAGGDTTEGAFDEGLRHAITKLSHLHFPTNQDAAERLQQMGEARERIFNFGSPGLDALLKVPRLSREELSDSLDFTFRSTNFLVTFHPVTEQPGTALTQFEEVLAALDDWPDAGVILTYPNTDTEGRGLMEKVEAFARRHPERVCAVKSLGLQRYASALGEVDAVIGNSSSGLYEAPSFQVPTVNIGDRQKGRLQGDSVINCPPERGAIRQAVEKALRLDLSQSVNPYGAGCAAPEIVRVIAGFPDWSVLRHKSFVSYEN